MTSKPITVQIQVSVAWWFTYIYIPCMQLLVNVMWYFGVWVEPDTEKLSRMVKKAVTTKVIA